jgi:glycosyltransferase involved in cell wall biosynthesis
MVMTKLVHPGFEALFAGRVGLKSQTEEDSSTGSTQVRSVKRVAFYLDALQGYGADRILVKIANGLADRKIQVDFVLSKQTNKASQSIHPAIRLFDLASSRLNVNKNVFGLAHYLHVHQPDVLFSSIHFNNVTAAAALMLSGVKSKLVVRQANTLRCQLRSYRFPIGLLLGFCTRLAYKRADLIISQSKGMSRDITTFMKADARKVQLVYNPTVTPNIFEQAQQPTSHAWFDQKVAPIILAGGRLKPQKDFTTLIQAFSKVKQQIPDAKLVILGEGPQRQELEALVVQLGIAESVDLIGFQKNPYAFIAMADVFVLSSQYEGLPNILIEALALGKEIVATDCDSGPAEILKYGKYGKLVPTNDPDQMADAILDTLEEPFACSRRVQAIEDFDQDSQVEKYITVFSHLLEREERLKELPIEPKAGLSRVAPKY